LARRTPRFVHDPQGKAMAQILTDIAGAVPGHRFVPGQPLAGWTERSPPAYRSDVRQ
jgi:hypothetical protein